MNEQFKNAYSEYQWVFRKGNGAKRFLVLVIKNRKGTWEGKGIFVALQNDLPKVSNWVSHEFLLAELDQYGLDQKSVTFFSTCLRNRRQWTKVVS